MLPRPATHLPYIYVGNKEKIAPRKNLLGAVNLTLKVQQTLAFLLLT